MEKKEKKGKYPFVKAGIVICIVLGTIWSLAGPFPRIVEDERGWHIVWEGSFAEAEADPGSGNSGILEIYFMNSTGTDDGARVENTSATIEGWCDANNLGYATADDTETDIAHSTNFELWVRVRGNSTNCKRGSDWWDTDLRVRITWSDEGLSDQLMDRHIASNNSAFDFLYVNMVLEGPYSLTKGQTTEIANIKFEAYY